MKYKDNGLMKFNQKKVERILDSYLELITDLSKIGNNVVIGGTCAIHFHGLNINREIDDLDLIIYKPTENQLAILKTLDSISLTEFYGKNKRTIKIKNKHNHTLNIIKENRELPKNLLNYNGFLVQSMENILEAKRSYVRYDSKSTTYARVKDMLDFQELKDNFNF